MYGGFFEEVTTEVFVRFAWDNLHCSYNIAVYLSYMVKMKGMGNWEMGAGMGNWEMGAGMGNWDQLQPTK
jgi:hypothetical protein